MHQRILQLTYVDELLFTVRDEFVKRHADFLRALISLQPTRMQLDAYAGDTDWDKEFLGILRNIERGAKRRPVTARAPAAEAPQELTDEPKAATTLSLIHISEPTRRS